MSAAGSLMFARYAYPPNALGFCGPTGAAEMLRADAPDEIARRARQFEGAWTYLEFLAAAAGLDDPLSAEVVEAYWIGNALLDRVSPADLLDRLLDRFAGQPGGTWRTARARALPHHSFQVFEVYPWAAMLDAAPARATPVALSVLDRCRIRTGVVVSVTGEQATVRCSPLTYSNGRLAPGPAADETANWSVGGRSLLAAPAPGDLVALHWDWICDVLTPTQANRIEALEARAVVRPRPGPGGAG